MKGIAYMEAIVRPQTWDHRDKIGQRSVLQALRSAAGEAMILRDNLFVGSKSGYVNQRLPVQDVRGL